MFTHFRTIQTIIIYINIRVFFTKRYFIFITIIFVIFSFIIIIFFFFVDIILMQNIIINTIRVHAITFALE